MSFNSNNNNNSEDDEFITINVKTLDSTNIELCVKKNMPVLEFRKMVTNKTGIPLDRQKLIFQGKVLKDDHTLATYSIKDGQTVHLVTRPMGSSGPSASSSSSAPPPQAAHQRPPTTTAQGVVVSSLAVPDNGGMPDLNSLVSNVLNSLGINAAGGTGAIISATTEPGRQAPHAIDVQTFTINANGNRPPTVTTTSATATTITTTNVPSGASQTAQNLSNANVGDMLDQVHSIFTRSDILLTRLAELRRRPNLTPEEQNEAQNLSAQLAPVISNLSGLLGDLSPLLDPNNNNATAAPQYGNLPPIAGVQLHIHANANELDRLPQQLAQLQNTVPFVNPNALQLQNLLQQPSIQFHPVPQQRFIIQRSFPGQHGVQLQQQQAPVIYQLPQQQQPGQVGTRNATVTIVADSGQGGAQPSFLGNLLQMQRNLQQAQTQNRPSAPATTGQTQSAQANPLQGLLQAATGGAGAQPSPLNQLLQSMGPMISNLLGGVQQQQQAAGGAATTASRPASGAAATAGAAPAAGSMGNLLSSLLPMVSQVIGQNQGAAGSPVQATVDDNSPFDSILMAVMEPLNVTDMLAIVNGNYAVFDNSREPLERSLRRLLNNDSSAENRARLVETWATYVRNAMTNNEQIQREIRSRTAQGDVIAETVRACRKHFAALIDLTLDTSAATPFSQLLRGWITNFIGEWVDSLVACFRNGEADAQAFMQTIMVAIFSLLGNQYAMIGNLGANIFIDHAMRIYRAYKQQQQGTQPQQQPRVSPQPQQATAQPQPQPQPLVQPQPQQQPPAPSQATPTAAAAAAAAPAPAAVPAPTPAPTPAAAAPTIAPSSTTTTTTRPMETETVDDEEPWLRGLSPSERSELIQTLQRDERLQRQMPPPSHEYSTAYAASASIATAKATTFNARNSTNRTETSNNNNNNDNNDNDSNNDNTGGSQQK